MSFQLVTQKKTRAFLALLGNFTSNCHLIFGIRGLYLIQHNHAKEHPKINILINRDFFDTYTQIHEKFIVTFTSTHDLQSAVRNIRSGGQNLKLTVITPKIQNAAHAKSNHLGRPSQPSEKVEFKYSSAIAVTRVKLNCDLGALTAQHYTIFTDYIQNTFKNRVLVFSYAKLQNQEDPFQTLGAHQTILKFMDKKLQGFRDMLQTDDKVEVDTANWELYEFDKVCKSTGDRNCLEVGLNIWRKYVNTCRVLEQGHLMVCLADRMKGEKIKIYYYLNVPNMEIKGFMSQFCNVYVQEDEQEYSGDLVGVTNNRSVPAPKGMKNMHDVRVLAG